MTCGGGKRTRGVRCIRKGTDRSMSIVRLSHCSADETLTMPKTSEDCNRNVCGEMLPLINIINVTAARLIQLMRVSLPFAGEHK